MCKAHSKVTHIKQQTYFHHLKCPGYNTESLLHPRPFRWWKYFCCFICVTLLWALHIVIKQQFFYIYLNQVPIPYRYIDDIFDISPRLLRNAGWKSIDLAFKGNLVQGHDIWLQALGVHQPVAITLGRLVPCSAITHSGCTVLDHRASTWNYE